MCQDKIAGAVDDADEGVDAIGDEAVLEGIDDRDAAATTGFEGDAGVMGAGELEYFAAAGGEETLVGGDDWFAGL